MKLIGFAGWSGAGKTTLITRLIPYLVSQGLTVSTVKHAHHAFDIDKPGKDSWLHRDAGAKEVLISSGKRWALMHELRDEAESSVWELLRHVTPVDLVLIEGYKNDAHPKIEVHRSANDKPFLHAGNPTIVGIATDVAVQAAIPRVDIDDIPAIADLVRRFAVDIEFMRDRQNAGA